MLPAITTPKMSLSTGITLGRLLTGRFVIGVYLVVKLLSKPTARKHVSTHAHIGTR